MKSLVDGPESVEKTTWADFSSAANAFTQSNASPVAPSVLSTTGNERNGDVTEYDDWQNFSETDATSSLNKSHQLSMLSKEVMRSCFETQSELDCEMQQNSCILYDKRLYERKTMPSGYAVSCPLIQAALHKVIHQLTPGKARHQLHLDLPAECNGFDWDSDRTPNRDSISPILFRPGPQESPIDMDFDHERATLGLAILGETELKVMCEEMETKFNHLSEHLVLNLQQRDKLVTELSVKNKFVSAILRVKSLKHSSCTNSGVDITGRPRSKSMKGKAVEERVNGKYLSSIIPYCPPEGNSWSVNTLLALIDILHAIAEDSEEVPTLVSEYITKEVLR